MLAYNLCSCPVHSQKASQQAAPDLIISKSSTQDVVTQGDPVTWVFVVSNTAGSATPAYDVVVTDTFPPSPYPRRMGDHPAGVQRRYDGRGHKTHHWRHNHAHTPTAFWPVCIQRRTAAAAIKAAKQD